MKRRIARMDPTKAAIRIVIASVHHLVKNREEMIQEVRGSGRPAAVALLDIILDCAGNVDARHQREHFLNLAIFIVWIYAKDGAYTDQGNWCLARLFEQGDEILEALDVKEPREWWINVVHAKVRNR